MRCCWCWWLFAHDCRPCRTPLQVCLACASAFVVLKESQENVDPFVFSSLRFLIAAAVFSPFMRKALRDERLVRAGVEIGFWAAGGAASPAAGLPLPDGMHATAATAVA